MFTLFAGTVHTMISMVLSVLEITSLLAHLGVSYIKTGLRVRVSYHINTAKKSPQAQTNAG
jgi:hypothetical protein